MGLTIHYTFAELSRVGSRARRRVEELREHAATLPFKLVGQVLEADQAQIKNAPRDDPRCWLFTQSTRYVERGGFHRAVKPIHLIAFSTSPGTGSEEANFGLAHYPARIKFDGRTVHTGLPGWSWSSFCKTQYAAAPDVGGAANFLKCHLAIVSLLDFADTLGILREVHDEGEYGDKRDLAALAIQVASPHAPVSSFDQGGPDAWLVTRG